MAIVSSVTVDDVHAKYRCTILYHLAVVLRIRGSLAEAKEACDVRSINFVQSCIRQYLKQFRRLCHYASKTATELYTPAAWPVSPTSIVSWARAKQRKH